MERILNFINGEFRPPRSGKFMGKEDPSRGKVYAELADSDATDVDDAVTAARAAFPLWSETPVRERSHLLGRLADLIERDLEKLAQAESRDGGKPITRSRDIEIPRAAENCRFFSKIVPELQGEKFVTDTRAVNETHSSPLGAVACISPWNLPLYLFTWKIAPALAAGNTVVAKPSEVTPMTASMLCALAREAGFPSGVLNVVHGTGAGAGGPLTEHPHIRAVSFTGSTATGRRIAQAAAGHFKKISLEMGGKNANIIFADADFDRALETTMRSTFENQGQICLCGSRILIERPLYDRFRAALVEKTQALRLGDPMDPNTQQGSLVSRAHWEKVQDAVRTARHEGGRILCGGDVARPGGELNDGYYYQPTLIEGLGPQTKTNQEEIFGPVATLIPFDDEEEAITIANGTRYGLSATVWSRDEARAQRVARALETGIVWINTWMLRDLRTPFGGVKESGVGREGGLYALKFFSEVKNICTSTESNS